MFGFGKKGAAIDAFADKLIAELRTRFPASKEEDLGSSRMKPARQLGKAAGDLIDRQFAGFVMEHKLGVYGKARLLNRVKWQMREHGYSSDFIDATVSELARSSARPIAAAIAEGARGEKRSK